METLNIKDIAPGYSVRYEIEWDTGGIGYPWDEHDGHGVIYSRRRGCNQYPEKAPHEIVLYCERFDAWFYDVRASIEIARRDGWGLSPDSLQDLARRIGRTPTVREIIAESVRQDAEYCRGWLTGRYSWVGVVVRLIDPDGETVDRDSLWGIEWDNFGGNDYPEECAHEIAESLIHAHGLDFESRRSAWRAALRETRERRYWSARDVQTVGA